MRSHGSALRRTMGEDNVLFTTLQGPREFTDRTTGYRVRALAPAEDPALWEAYFRGLRRGYEAFGVDWIIDNPSVEDSDDVSVIFVALDAKGKVVGGTRAHGPIRQVEDAYALIELADVPRIDLVRRTIARRIPEGVIEVKGGWVDPELAERRVLANTVARCAVHAMNILGVDDAIGTMAEHTVRMWTSSGGRAIEFFEPVAYPDHRYRTVMVWWSRQDLPRLASPETLALLEAETEELGRAAGPSPSAAADQPPLSEPAAARAIILDPRRAADAEQLERYRSDPGVVVLDETARQQAELVRLRPWPGSEVLEEAPRWVYYPWRRTLVCVLGPQGFALLRLDRNRNKITAPEQAALRRLRIGVIGLSVGHAVAHTLVMEGLCGELRLADFDEMELSNLNRVPATVLDLGVNKAVVAARRIAEIDPYLPVTLVPEGADAANMESFLDGLDLVVEECDSLDVKVLVREAARRRGIPVIMETSDRGLLDVERFDVDRQRPSFHGLLGGLRSSEMAALSTRDKVPYVLRILDPAQLSADIAASMTEVDRTIGTWPQLAGDISLGAASVAAAVLRWGTGRPLPSGRVRIDLEQQLDGLAEPPPPYELPLDVPASQARPAGSPGEAVRHAATLAPSGGNVQPWTLELDDGGLSVRVDPARTSTMDMGFRGSYVATGAALWNARVEAAARGMLGPVRLFPEPDDPWLVAHLGFGREIDVALAELEPAMLARCANRRLGTPVTIDDDLARRLTLAVEAEGASLCLVTSVPVLRELGYVFAEADRLRYLDPRLHAEMISELRWPGRDSLTTGIDVRTLELDATDLTKLQVAARGDVMERLAAWDAGSALGEPSRDRVRSSSALAVVVVPGTSAVDYVKGGSATERLWAMGQQEGLAIYPMSPPFLYCTEGPEYVSMVGASRAGELQHLSEEFRRLAGIDAGAGVALILRLGVAGPPEYRSLRRDDADEAS